MDERFEIFTGLITRINRNIKKIENQEMTDYNLRSSHISCLYHLYSVDYLTATELCDRCEEDKATISRTISYLENNGFLICDSKTAKRYKSPLILTEKGREVGKKITDKVNLVLDKISVAMTEEERIDFYRNLTTISDTLENIGNHFVEADFSYTE